MLATQREFSFWVAIGGLVKGAALVLLGQHQAGLAQLNESLTLYFGTGAGVFKTTFLALLAEAYAGTGDLEKGLIHLEEALAAVETMNEHFYEAELYRLQGKLLLADGADAAEAEARFQQAIAIARPAGQIAGTASYGQPDPAVAVAGEAAESPPDAGRDLWLVHGGV